MIDPGGGRLDLATAMAVRVKLRRDAGVAQSSFAVVQSLLAIGAQKWDYRASPIGTGNEQIQFDNHARAPLYPCSLRLGITSGSANCHPARGHDPLHSEDRRNGPP